jgi:hypothetical protein
MPRNETNIQRNLTEIEFGFGVMSTIQSIGFASFANLPALGSLSFSNQHISHIEFHAFSFYEPSNKTLIIDLTENNLNDSSFEIGSFSGANRYKVFRKVSVYLIFSYFLLIDHSKYTLVSTDVIII